LNNLNNINLGKLQGKECQKAKRSASAGDNSKVHLQVPSASNAQPTQNSQNMNQNSTANSSTPTASSLTDKNINMQTVI